MLPSLLFRKKRDTSSGSSSISISIISEPPLGLKTLADTTLVRSIAPNSITRNFVASRSAFLSPSSSNGGIINDEEEEGGGGGGREIEDAEESEEEEEEENACCWATYGRKGHSRRFPPPIPLLARTGNQPGHMPWVLKRTYKDDGSLVIQEIRTRHHHYFRTHRENGRLVLRLVELEDYHSPLFTSSPKHEVEKEKEMPAVAQNDQVKVRRTSSEAKFGSIGDIRTGEIDVPALALPSTVMLPSSMLEPVCGKGCFGNGRSLPLQQMPLSMLRVVRG